MTIFGKISIMEDDVWLLTDGDDNKIMVAREASAGVYAKRFYDLSNFSGMSKDELAPLMDSSLKTISRYHEQKKNLSPSDSEKVLMLEQLFTWGQKIFASHRDFELWLQKPSYGLSGEVPFSLLNTITGIDLVIGELKNIATGNLS